MKNVIVGVGVVDFESQKEGRVSGTKLYMENKNIDVFGMQTSDLFLKSPRDDDLLSLLSKGETVHKFVGMTIDIDFDRKGKLVGYELEV